MYSAVYLPYIEIESPTKHGFQTEDAAWDYVFENMCEGCKNERQRKLDEPDREDNEYWCASLFPPCACEWAVVSTEKLDKVEDFGDILIAMGAKRVWANKDDTKNI